MSEAMDQKENYEDKQMYSYVMSCMIGWLDVGRTMYGIRFAYMNIMQRETIKINSFFWRIFVKVTHIPK